MTTENVIPMLIDSYMAMIKNSLGSNLFRNVYAIVNGVKIDITNNGELSCAYFVSSILLILKLIKEVHVTVSGTIKDLESSGWSEISKPRTGSIVIWEEKDFGNNSSHKHIGFYIGNQQAISNDFRKGYPIQHALEYENRKVEKILWNSRLENK